MAHAIDGALPLYPDSMDLLQCGGQQVRASKQSENPNQTFWSTSLGKRQEKMLAGVSLAPVNDYGMTNSGSGTRLVRDGVASELNNYFGNVLADPEHADMSWSNTVAIRWDALNGVKSTDELGLLSWNVNGRLRLRGCRESLLRRWALKGFVDVGIIQSNLGG